MKPGKVQKRNSPVLNENTDFWSHNDNASSKSSTSSGKALNYKKLISEF